MHNDFREQKMNSQHTIDTTSDVSTSQVRNMEKWSSRNQLQFVRLGVDKVLNKFDQDINIHTNSELIIVYLVHFVSF